MGQAGNRCSYLNGITQTNEKPRATMYNIAKDCDTLHRNWKKTCGLLKREEYSMAIVRSATCAEIAANIMIRQELVTKRKLKIEFVDHLLVWANGLHGKITKIMKPLLHGTAEWKAVQSVETKTRKLSEARNSIAHGGEFCAKDHAAEIGLASKKRTPIQAALMSFSLCCFSNATGER
jgi:hypothetical protein